MKKTKALIALVVVAVVGFVATKLIPKSEDQILVPPTEPTPTKETATVATTSTPVTNPVSASHSTYKDGTYSARGSYYSPEGLEMITVTLTLKNDVVTDTSAVQGANDSTSVRYQNIFINNYKPFVIGKNVDTIKLDKVSGSSLTGAGFNQAVTKIKAEAAV